MHKTKRMEVANLYPNGNYDKKALNMLILEILDKYTDSEHRLKQEEIIKLLEINYGVRCDRRSIKSNILSLQTLNYDIPLKHGYYLMNRTFSHEELRLLIDCVNFSPDISRQQANRLIERLIGLGNRYFRPKVKYISHIPETPYLDGSRISENLNALSDAIEQKRKIRFTYNEYGTDFGLCPVREITVSPYQIVVNDRFYFLVGNEASEETISYYRVDQITEICPLNEMLRPRNLVLAYKQGYRLPKHRAEKLLMESGEGTTNESLSDVRLRTNPAMMGHLMDAFGKDFHVEAEDDETILVTLSADSEMIFRWAMMYGNEVEILEPEILRAKLRKAAERLMNTYGGATVAG